MLCIAAALLLPAPPLHAALPTDPGVSGPASFTGQLLVAAPELRQPEFEHTVILLAQHNREGALGVVINRPIGERPIAEVLKAFGADAAGVTGTIGIFNGGPVEPAVALVLHGAEYSRPDTLDIDGRVAMTLGPDVIRDIGLGNGPEKRLVAFGYAGWGPAQLEDELAHGVWIAVAEDPALVFDDDRAKVWADALARHKSAK
jgi:putative transcriptional regulator